MNTLTTIKALREVLGGFRKAGDRLAIVPTMGHLHRGHLRLVEDAKARADRVVATVFVNPSQFGPSEDFDRYPRTPEADQALLEGMGTDLLFMPTLGEMFPRSLKSMTRVEVPGLQERLCGASRPGHFAGVAQIVLKLFNLMQPDWAFFGEKDFQQLQIIRRMVRDLDLGVDVVGVPTVRDEQGLALSSRNSYLSREERARAPHLYQVLQQVVDRAREEDQALQHLEGFARESLESFGFRVEYVSILDEETLEPPKTDRAECRLRVFAAARLGETRLIDNLALESS